MTNERKKKHVLLNLFLASLQDFQADYPKSSHEQALPYHPNSCQIAKKSAGVIPCEKNTNLLPKTC